MKSERSSRRYRKELQDRIELLRASEPFTLETAVTFRVAQALRIGIEMVEFDGPVNVRNDISMLSRILCAEIRRALEAEAKP